MPNENSHLTDWYRSVLASLDSQEPTEEPPLTLEQLRERVIEMRQNIARPARATQTIPEGAVVFTGFDENGIVRTRPATPEQDPEYFTGATTGRYIPNRSHAHGSTTTTANPLRDFDYASNINPYVYYGDNTPRINPIDQPSPQREPNYTNIVRQRGQNTLITYTNTWGGRGGKRGLETIPMFNDLQVDGSNRTKVNSKVRVTYARVDDVVLDLLVKQLKIDETTPVQTEFAF